MADAPLTSATTPLRRPAAARRRASAHVFPASFSQRRLWLLDRLTPGVSSYTLPAAVRVDTAIDKTAFERAVDALVRRHDSLRTSFAEVHGEPVQVVAAEGAVTVRAIDIGQLSGGTPDERLQRVLTDLAVEPFDLGRGPLVRVALLTLGRDRHVVSVTCHHIVADGASVDVLFRDLAALYAAARTGRPGRLPRLRVQYPDFAVAQRSAAAGGRMEGGLTFWREALRDLPELLPMPLDRPRPREARFRGESVPVVVPAALAGRLRLVAKSHDTTMFVVLLAAWQLLLHRYSGADHVAVGSPVSGRHHEHLREVVGFFANTVVFSARFADDPTVAEHLMRTRRAVLEGLAHGEVPFEAVVAAIAPRRTLAHQPVCQVLFGLDTVMLAAADQAMPAHQRRHPVRTGTSKCDLTLTLTDGGTTVTGALEYDSDLFEPDTVAQMTASYLTLLSGVVEYPDARVSTVPILAPGAATALVHASNDPARAYPRAIPVHVLVGRHAAARPDAGAVVDGAATISYGALVGRAAVLAARLAAEGVATGDRVGVCVERLADLVVSWLAVLQAGAAYVPLEPTHPPARLALLVGDAAVRLTIVTPASSSHMPDGARMLDLTATGAAAPGGACRGDVLGGDAPAYLVYTSGSTGTPKGAVVPHRAVTRLALATNYVQLEPTDRVAFASNVAFDAATFEVWAPLLNGACLVVVPRSVLLEPAALAAFLRDQRVTVLFLTTALFNQVVVERPDAFATLRCLMVGGEMADAGRFRDVLRHGPPQSLLHVYGPTETTTFATYHPVTSLPDDVTSVPIGRPIGHTRVFVVDRHLGLVPAGVPGELVVGGDGVALGYWARPELTAAAFLEPGWLPGEGRAYRTGDRVRWRGDGVLEILGRFDDQVKIRGFRVEPGEVEAVLAQLPEVRHACVTAKRDRDGARLAAYVVPASTTTSDQLRERLRERLPEPLVPAAILLLDRMPLTANGKVDRARLPAPDVRHAAGPAGVPSNATEASLAAVWAAVLGLDQVGVHDNFFALGGDSIRAIQMAARAARVGLNVTPRQLFAHQTVAALAAVARPVGPTATDQGFVTGAVPLTPIQAWWLRDAPDELHHFNQAVLVDLPRGTGGTQLEAAVSAVIGHHDALRLRLERASGEWRQRIAPPDGASLVTEHVLRGDSLAQSAEVASVAAAVQASLDLDAGPLISVALFQRGGPHAPRALVVAHHLAVDVVSWRIVVEDLQAALDATATGTPLRLPPKTASFKAWAERLASEGAEPSADALDPWIDAQWAEACRLPDGSTADHPDNTVANRREVTVRLDAAPTSNLRRVAGTPQGVKAHHLVIAAGLSALGRWAGPRRLALDIEGHGRDALGEALDVTRTVGWFTEITPVAFELSAPAAADSDRHGPRRGSASRGGAARPPRAGCPALPAARRGLAPAGRSGPRSGDRLQLLG